MNDEVAELLKRQAQWQRSRAALSWSEKLRQSVALRRGLSALRRQSGPVRDGARSPLRAGARDLAPQVDGVVVGEEDES